MKLAKKALVVLLAVMMIASMSAIAFAAGTPTTDVEVSEVNDKGVFTVTILVKNAANMKTIAYTVKFNPAVVTYKKATDGSYAKIYGKQLGEKADPLGAVIDTKANDGELSGGLGLVEYVFSDADLKAKIAEAQELAEEEGEEFNVADKDLANACEARFVIVTFRFEVADKNAAKADINVDTKLTIEGAEDAIANVTKTVVQKDNSAEEEASRQAAEEASRKAAEEESSRKAAEEASKAAEESKKAEEASKAAEESRKAAEESRKAAEEASRQAAEESKKNEEASKDDASKEDPSKEDASKEDTSKKDDTKKDDTKKDDTKKNDTKSSTKAPQKDGGVKTGDNMALAAAFGVVALAGAAFVITKKRK